jgi:hypothetical protein
VTGDEAHRPELVGAVGGRAVWFRGLCRPFVLGSVFGGDPYACVVVDCASHLKPSEREALARALVSTGCRYVVCAGTAADAWEEEVGWAHLRSDPGLDPRTTVMTMAQDGQSLDEVLSFAFTATQAVRDGDGTEVVLRQVLVLLVGEDGGFRPQLDRLVAAAAGA